MKSKRLAQVEDWIRDVVAQELSRDWDFGSAVVSVTHVIVSPDLSTAKALVSVLAAPKDQDRVWKRLQAGTRRLQRCLARESTMKKTPMLSLEMDTSIEEGSRVLQIMKNLAEVEGRGPIETDGRVDDEP